MFLVNLKQSKYYNKVFTRQPGGTGADHIKLLSLSRLHYADHQSRGRKMTDWGEIVSNSLTESEEDLRQSIRARSGYSARPCKPMRK